MKPVREFNSLPPKFQEKMIALLEAKFALKGETNPKKRALRFLAGKKPKQYRQWQTINFLSMQSIDRHRVKLGLKKIHFP
jgi:hypothetical protein